MKKLTRDITVAIFATLCVLIAACSKDTPIPTSTVTRPAMVKVATKAPAGASTATDTPAPTPALRLTTPQLKLAGDGLPQLRGTNITGGEMQWNSSNTASPVSNTDYLFVTHQDIDYLAGKGVNFLRIVFSWEGVQPNGINTPLATTGNSGTYVSTFFDRVTYATSKGMYVMIEPHGADSSCFARYKGNLVGSSQVPNAAFADLWTRLATQFKANPKVMYGLSNEPNNMSTAQWFQAAQAAIVAIRATGATQLILVPGNGWTNAQSWTQNWYDTASPQVSNATAYLKYINDPLKNTAVTVHLYFDPDGGGGSNDIVSGTIGSERLKVTIDWAKANGVKVQLGEFGAANSASAKAAVADLISYANANTATLIGWSWWAYGPPAWWGGYQFTLDPSKSYTVDSFAMAWLQPSFVPPVVTQPDAGVVDSGTDSGTPVSDAGTQDAGSVDAGTPDAGPPATVATIRPGTSTTANPGDQGFTSTKTLTAAQASALGVKAGTYTLKVETRTQYSDNHTFCVNLILNNTNTGVDVDWQQMTVDLRGHTLQSSWNSTVTGTTGVITIVPTAATKTVVAGDRNSIGLCVTRQADTSKAHYQVLVKSLTW